MMRDVFEATNIHPAWRTLWLNHTRQVRMMMRSGRYRPEGRRLIKEAQRHMLAIRRRLAEARHDQA